MQGELFDSSAEFLIEIASRPHWSQNNAIVFITFRTGDSIPADVLKQWNEEKLNWLKERGVHTQGSSFQQAISQITKDEQREFRQRFNRQREDFLDLGRGECVLRQPEIAETVSNTLRHFDGERYHLGDFVVMPNHVHLLGAFNEGNVMRNQVASWLHYSAREINEALGRKGHFWQQEPFDHLVRNVQQLEYLRQYIRENPLKAKLKEGEYLYSECQSR